MQCMATSEYEVPTSVTTPTLTSVLPLFCPLLISTQKEQKKKKSKTKKKTFLFLILSFFQVENVFQDNYGSVCICFYKQNYTKPKFVAIF